MDLQWKIVAAALSGMLATAPAEAAVVCPLGSHDAGGLCAFNARPTIVLPTSFTFDVASGFYLDARNSFQADGDPISFSWDMNSDGVADLSGGRVFVPGNYFGSPQVGTAFRITLDVRDLYSNLHSYGVTSAVVVPAAAAVPEPATWAMMLIGFGMIGAISRYRRRAVKVSFG